MCLDPNVIQPCIDVLEPMIGLFLVVEGRHNFLPANQFLRVAVEFTQRVRLFFKHLVGAFGNESCDKISDWSGGENNQCHGRVDVKHKPNSTQYGNDTGNQLGDGLQQAICDHIYVIDKTADYIPMWMGIEKL